jgi:hypothetical protein
LQISLRALDDLLLRRISRIERPDADEGLIEEVFFVGIGTVGWASPPRTLR